MNWSSCQICIYFSNSLPVCVCVSVPSKIKARCPYFNKGYSILVVWEQPIGVWSEVEINVNGKDYTVHRDSEQSLNINGVKPATTHDVSVTVLSSSHTGPPTRSETFRFPCRTDPRGECRHIFPASPSRDNQQTSDSCFCCYLIVDVTFCRSDCRIIFWRVDFHCVGLPDYLHSVDKTRFNQVSDAFASSDIVLRSFKLNSPVNWLHFFVHRLRLPEFGGSKATGGVTKEKLKYVRTEVNLRL